MNRNKNLFGREKVYQLIELADARPELWDCSLKAYKNRNLKNKIHESIAQTLNLTATLPTTSYFYASFILSKNIYITTAAANSFYRGGIMQVSKLCMNNFIVAFSNTS